jgi:hypothetical protein
VFRIDADLAPAADPVAHVEADHLGDVGVPALRAGQE